MPNCPHTEVEFIPTPQFKHHGKEVCRKCGQFVRWVPKPETLERLKRIREEVGRLKDVRLTDWESEFVLSVEKAKGKMSPKQAEIWEKLKTKYLP